ncbi:hypothetical protein A3860_39430 [Niastella vici]|uniref:Restriction endonuclease type IV Mrr domain-containing protein n=1 Tax=Niastella vici TaxID=1703345 RepID=A0A1V9FKA2_9BACT|nr:restriction endonuclease [Niastella vici]OQP58711.1 hypothetical protein A3860_39430 [Niastella vici]
MNKDYIEKYNEFNNYGDNSPNEVLQERGREFESLINEIMYSEGVLLNKSYHTIDNKSEQIDGAIEINGRVFLIEVKWVNSNIAASELYSFIGKVENKFHGTLGVFISRHKLSQNFINALNKGRRQSVIIIHGDDLDDLFTLEGPTFSEYISYCQKTLSYDNRTHVPVREYIEINNSKDTLPGKIEQYNREDIIVFLKQFIFNNVIVNAGEIMLELDKKSAAFQDNLIDYVLSNYLKLYQYAIKEKQYYTLSNLRQFLEIVTPSQSYCQSKAPDYYSEILPKQIKRLETVTVHNWFSKYYQDLDLAIRLEFEKFLITTFDNEFGTWDTENQLTYVIEELWNKLQAQTKEQLIKFYLDIFISKERLEKFAQKAFASWLINENQVSKTIMENWLSEKIIKAKGAYEGLNLEDLSVTVATTYNRLSKPIGFYTVSDWLAFIRQKVLE